METKLKVYRAMRDMTQEQLAREVGVTRQTIIAIEKGDYNPSLELAFRIARFFEASVEDIFIYNPN
jgi:putative transcriptional regulator